MSDKNTQPALAQSLLRYTCESPVELQGASLSESTENKISREYRVYSKFGPLVVMLCVAMLYAMMIAISVALIDLTNGYSIYGMAYPIGVSTFALTGAWSVMGFGRVLLRNSAAILLASIVVMGLMAGILFAENFLQMGFFGEESSQLMIIALSWFTISVVVQVPFWMLRAITGCHLCFDETEEKPLISLRDMFLVMLIFALAISASQWCSRIIVEDILQSVVVGEEMYVDGKFEMITEENLEQMQDYQLGDGVSQVSLFATLYFCIPALLTLPIFWWVFRTKRFLVSGLLSMVYAMSISGAVLLLIFVLGGGGEIDLEVTLMSITTVASTFFLVWLPLALLRRSGLVLRTKRHPYAQ